MFDGKFFVDARPIESFEVSLNSALAIGNDVIRLMARLHGQCEIHCWVEGKNRSWLASIIRQGLTTEILHQKVGWQEVASFLDSRDDCPVVCSYSVCEYFPNRFILPEGHRLLSLNDDDAFDEFDALSNKDKWSICMEGLRSSNDCLELTPEYWEGFRFGSRLSIFDIRAYALGLSPLVVPA